MMETYNSMAEESITEIESNESYEEEETMSHHSCGPDSGKGKPYTLKTQNKKGYVHVPL